MKQKDDLHDSVKSTVELLEQNSRAWVLNYSARASELQGPVNDTQRWNEEEQTLLMGCSQKCDEINQLSKDSRDDFRELSADVIAANADLNSLNKLGTETNEQINKIDDLIYKLKLKMEALELEGDLDEEQNNWLLQAQENITELEDNKQSLQSFVAEIPEARERLMQKIKDLSQEFSLSPQKSNISGMSSSASVLKAEIDTLHTKASTEREIQSNIFNKASSFFASLKESCLKITSGIKSIFSKSNEACIKAEQLIDSCPDNRQNMQI